MIVTERSIGDVTVLDIDGRITVRDGALWFGTCLRRSLRQGRVNVVLNLNAVPYIDWTALGELIRAHTTASQTGGGVKLLRVADRVRDLLALAKLLTAFEMFDDEAAALASFAAAVPN